MCRVTGALNHIPDPYMISGRWLDLVVWGSLGDWFRLFGAFSSGSGTPREPNAS